MNATDPTGHCYFAATAGGRGAMSIGCGGGGGGFGGAAGTTIQLAVDAVGVIVAGATVANAVQGHQESVALPEQNKAEVNGVPLVEPSTTTNATTSVPDVPSQQVWADPLTTENTSSSIVYSWQGQNTTVVGQKSSGRLSGYTEGVSDLTGGQNGAAKLFEQLTGRSLQVSNPASTAPTDSYIESGKLEVFFRPTSKSKTPVIEIIDHVAKTIEKVHFNN